jgi:dTDP-glucose 4,6-dehydratase
LIPLTIRNAIENLPIPVYGNGENIRDWLYVEDHCRAIDLVFHKGKKGETYNIGANNEFTNIDLVTRVCEVIDEIKGGGPRKKLIEFVEDRAGHDFRYAIDASKIMNDLNWRPVYDFDTALRNTVKWYLENEKWISECISGEYKEYYNKIYG